MTTPVIAADRSGGAAWGSGWRPGKNTKTSPTTAEHSPTTAPACLASRIARPSLAARAAIGLLPADPHAAAQRRALVAGDDLQRDAVAAPLGRPRDPQA